MVKRPAIVVQYIFKFIWCILFQISGCTQGQNIAPSLLKWNVCIKSHVFYGHSLIPSPFFYEPELFPCKCCLFVQMTQTGEFHTHPGVGDAQTGHHCTALHSEKWMGFSLPESWLPSVTRPALPLHSSWKLQWKYALPSLLLAPLGKINTAALFVSVFLFPPTPSPLFVTVYLQH